jgi:hypothetical protein
MNVVAESLAHLRFQESLKEFDQLRDDSRVMHERMRYVHEASRLLILDAYVSGQLSLILYVQTFFEEDEIGRFLKIPNARPEKPFASFVLHLNAVDVSGCQNRNDESMLIPVTEIVNSPQGNIPSIVRLYFVEHEPVQVRAGNVYFSIRKPSFHFFGGLPHREFGPIINERRNQFLDCDQPSIVEGAFKVVECVSNHQGNVIEGMNIDESVFKELTSGCRIGIDSSSVSIVQQRNSSFDVRDVLIGPLNLQARAVK